MSMRAWSRVLSFLLVAGLAFWFTMENAGQRVPVDLILFRVRLSLPLLVFLSVLAGMLAVLLAGLKADLRTRRAIERYRWGIGGGPERQEALGRGRSPGESPRAGRPPELRREAEDPRDPERDRAATE